ncbi:MAG TPA: glycine cleavage system protein H [Vicinamibacterales bacterium]|nr:glycine cleavage system protein H [Vicinamibacterales bacterium]
MFEAAIGWLSMVVLFLAGLVARVLLALLVIAAVVAPIAGLLYAWRGGRAVADRVAGLQRLGHVLWRRGCYYTPGHLWLKPARARAVRVGLDDVAQRVLPDVTVVELPLAGTHVRQGEAIGRIECAGGAVTVRAPVAGTITAVNGRLQRTPRLLHADPYRRAWMVQMTPADERYRDFRTGDRARTWLAAEDQRLARFFEQQLGVAAADGGDLILPPQKLLTPAQWEAIRTEFLESPAP